MSRTGYKVRRSDRTLMNDIHAALDRLEESIRQLEEQGGALDADAICKILEMRHAVIESRGDQSDTTVDDTPLHVSWDAMRDSEGWLRALLIAGKDAEVAIGQDGRIVLFNRAAEEMFGRTASEMIGQPVEVLMPEAYREQHRKHVAGYLRRGEPNGAIGKTVELPAIHRDGHQFPIELSLSAAEYGGGRFVLGVIRDITDRKEAELALRRAVDRQTKLNQVLRDEVFVSARLEDKLKRITEIVVNVFDGDFCRIWVTRPGDLCDAGCAHAEINDLRHTCRLRDQCLHLVASSGRYTHIDGEAHRRVPLGCYKIGRVATGQDAKFLTNDVLNDPRVHNHEWAAELGLVSFVGYRLVSSQGEPIGVLALFAKHPITPDEDALLEGLATTSSHMIQAARAEEELKRHLERLDGAVQERTADLRRLNEELRSEIADRLRAEEALRAAHAETEQLLKSISSVLISVGADGCVKRWNEAARETLGVEASDAVGRPLRECLIQWDWPRLTELIVESLAKGVPTRAESLRFRRRDGTDGFLGVTINPVESEGEGRGAYLIQAADITERRVLEMQLVHAQKLESIGQLAAGIAHEINTPTQFVGDNTRFLHEAFRDLRKLLDRYAEVAEACRGGPVPPELLARMDATAREIDLPYLAEEIPKAIDQSLEGVARVAKIVRAMKDFSHPGGEEKKAVDLNKAIESTITVARNEWKYVAEMVTDFDPALPPVPCLAGDVNQVILNLIINAAHAIADVVAGTDAKGQITVGTRRGRGWVEVRVSDTGTGIPEAVRPKIFEPFFTTKEVGKGTGQGLAIARSVVVEKHGGSITFETEVGKGTTFVIRLPLESAEPNGPETARHD
jgi:PAS domain S-box-containing protein